MKNTLLILVGILLTISACQSNEVDFELSEIKIKNDFLKANSEKVDHLKRTKLMCVRDSFYFLNLSKSNQFIRVNLTTGFAQVADCEIKGEVQAVNYSLDKLAVMTEDSVLVFNGDGALQAAYESPLDSTNFVINTNPVSKECLHRYGDYYYVQLGNLQNELNFVDTSVLLFFNRDTSFKKFDYPTDYAKRYLHNYSVQSARHDNHFFYAPSLLPRLSCRSFGNQHSLGLKLNPSGFLLFDSTKWNDVLYIHDYSLGTKKNVRLLANANYVFLIQAIPTNTKEQWRYECLVFNHELDQVSTFVLPERVDINTITVYPAGLFIFHPYKSSIVRCSQKLA